MKVHKLIIIFLSIGVLISSCNKDEDSTFNNDECLEIFIDEPFEAKINDTFCINDEIEITILDVTDDRCPCDMICIWQGQFIIDIEVIKGTEREEYVLYSELIAEAPLPFELHFSYLNLIAENDCETDLSKMSFELLIN